MKHRSKCLRSFVLRSQSLSISYSIQMECPLARTLGIARLERQVASDRPCDPAGQRSGRLPISPQKHSIAAPASNRSTHPPF
jgi:hypothetical protein